MFVDALYRSIRSRESVLVWLTSAVSVLRMCAMIIYFSHEKVCSFNSDFSYQNGFAWFAICVGAIEVGIGEQGFVIGNGEQV